MNSKLTLLGLAAGSALVAAQSVPTDQDPWLDDLGKAEVLARKTGKPILALFR